MSPRQNVDRSDHIRVFLESALDAAESCLRRAVLRRHLTAARTRPARVLRLHSDKPAPVPRQLIFQLPAELVPALVENGLVQAGLGPNIRAWAFACSRRRPGHVPYLQVLDTDHRVVFADHGRGLVQVIAAGVADAGVDALDSGFRLPPVGAELRLATHRSLSAAQSGFVPFETVERSEEGTIAERSESGDANIDADCAGCLRHGLFHLTRGLDRDKPLARMQRYRGVAHLAKHIPAAAVANPSELGQKDATVGLIQLDLLRVGVAKAVALALLLEARMCGPSSEKVLVGSLQILERMLQRVHRGVLEPRCSRSIAPLGETLCHRHVADELAASPVVFDL
ncbi:hypothetical protein D9M69_263790 [compost metagenome]